MKNLNELKILSSPEYRKRHPITGDIGDHGNGFFRIELHGVIFNCLVSDGGGWDHVSVSLSKKSGKPIERCPTWEEMCRVKEWFFEDHETVIQFHPKDTEYISNHKYCLHLWRRQEGEHELPPSFMVGFKSLNKPKE